MRILSYNLLKHKAISELSELTADFSPDALCLQEINVQDAPRKLGPLELVIGTSKNRLGLAVYLDTDKYQVEDAVSYRLRDANYDKLAKPAHERLLGVRAQVKDTGKSFVVGSFHASPLTALNTIRRDQIHDGLEHLGILGKDSPLVMLGDYNYPMFRKKLALEMEQSGFDMAFSDFHTYHNKMVRGHFDFAVSKGFGVNWLRTLRRGISDHLPILAQIEALA